MISVHILEDHPIAADGLKSCLEIADDIQVIGMSSRGENILEVMARQQPNVGIFDLELDGSQVDGIQAARLVRHSFPAVKIIALSAHRDQKHVLGAFQAGVDGYLVKTSSEIEIIHAIRTVYSGQSVFDPKVLRIVQLFINMDEKSLENSLLNLEGVDPLTKREWEVLELIGKGMTNQEIADELIISLTTVKSHTGNIFGKLSIDNRDQARVWYHLNRHRFNKTA